MNTKILIPFYGLILIGGVIIYAYFPVLAELLHYGNKQFFFMEYLAIVLLGTAFLVFLYKTNGVKLFDWLGAGALVLSLLIVGYMTFFPAEIHLSQTQNLKFLMFEPLPLFIVGTLWFIDFVYRQSFGSNKWFWVLAVSFLFLFWFLAFLVDMHTSVLLGMTVLSVLWILYREYKVFFLLLGGVVGVIGYYIISSPYRFTRFQNLLHPREGITEQGLNYTVSRLHDGLFIFNSWGMGLYIVVASIFLWMIYVLWRSNNNFLKSIAVLFLLDLILHFIVLMNWTIVKAPVLFMVEQGRGVMVASFVLIGMVLLRFHHSQDSNDLSTLFGTKNQADSPN